MHKKSSKSSFASSNNTSETAEKLPELQNLSSIVAEEKTQVEQKVKVDKNSETSKTHAHISETDSTTSEKSIDDKHNFVKTYEDNNIDSKPISQPDVPKIDFNFNDGLKPDMKHMHENNSLIHDLMHEIKSIISVMTVDPDKFLELIKDFINNNLNDMIDDNPGRQLVNGTEGNDKLTGKVVYGFAGDDELTAHGNGASLYGAEGADTLHGGSRNDFIAGNQGHDILEGGRGNDILQAGKGNDSITDGEGDDHIKDGLGKDIITLMDDSGNDTIVGSADGEQDIISITLFTDALNPKQSTDTFQNFEVDHDKIRISSELMIPNSESMLTMTYDTLKTSGAIEQVGSNVVLHGVNTDFVLEKVSLDKLTAANFEFLGAGAAVAEDLTLTMPAQGIAVGEIYGSQSEMEAMNKLIAMAGGNEDLAAL